LASDRESADDGQRRRHPHYEHRLLLIAALCAAPFALLCILLLAGMRPSPEVGIAWLLLALGLSLLGLRTLRRQAAYPLRTVATLLEALREGDYLQRGRMDMPKDALGELIRDVNELRDTLHQQRIKVRETTALIAKVIETVDIAVFTFGPDQHLRLVNAAGRALAGIQTQSSDELQRLDAATLQLGDLLDGPRQYVIEREFAGSHGRWEVRHRTFREGGEVHHLMVIADLSRVLREQERLAWQRLVQVLGHEINNSLTPIRSISETLAGRLDSRPDDPAVDEDLKDGLDLIANRSEALVRFVKGYTLLAKLPKPRLESVDLGALIRRAARFEDTRRVLCEGPDAIVEADPAQLEQLLLNLIKNGLEASPPDGTVRIAWTVDSQGAIIDIEDEGAGVPDSENLFVPFFTTKPGGNGIGLVLARQIAEAHGGQVELGNREPTGCRARLRLPANP
jgi:nitrogen fixation/metabolism regulation signal transduction histidine kinase